MRLTIVVPCYNEEHRLPVAPLREFRSERVETTFLLVNDGSTDRTLALLQSLAADDPAKFQLLDLPQNLGKAEAVRRGMLQAMEGGADYCGFWDADLATPLSEISGFLEVFEARAEIEVVFAARVRLLGRSISRNPARHYVGRVGATLISSSLGLAVYDTQCGAKIFRTSQSMAAIFEEPFISRWLFDVEIIARLVRQRGRDAAARAIYELPINVWHDVKGSKVGPFDFLRSLRDLARIHRAYRRPG